MSDLPANWRVYTAGDPVLRPRRRRVFYTGRRRSDRVMARLMMLAVLALAAIGVTKLFAVLDAPVEPVSTQAQVYYPDCATGHAEEAAQRLGADTDRIACQPSLGR